ncbi:MAG: metal ABC transporter substrate-binding protein [Candidatus Omnitrophota bacterium]|nr:metal ABC transporter substrate-binding protein [Candidatus Omnitrophota bacterium]
MRKTIAILLAVIGTWAPVSPARGEPAIRVAATLSSFADLVKQIGGDRVEVSTIAPPRFNPHFIEPRPSDVLKVKKADLLVHGGLDLEAWRGPLLDAAGNPDLFPGGKGELDLSRGIPLLEVPDRQLSRLDGDIHLFGNPHYWTSPENGRIMARAIAGKLSEIDPTHAEEYRKRLADFLTRLDGKIAEWKQLSSSVRGKEVIGYHNEWPYLMEFVGVKLEQFLEPKPGIPPSPKHLGFLENYMKERGIKVIIQPTYFPKSSSEVLARRTGATVVILCQSVKELPEASDYIAFVDYNVRQLVRALEGK